MEYEFGKKSLSIYCPADPDLFLDDNDVMAANEKNDYMPFWTFLWPSAIQMASLMDQAPWESGSSVLELGSGLGLVGLAALKRGDEVTFSDYDPTALHVCRMSSIKNGLPDPSVLQLDWRQPIDEQYDAIIGCEVTYDAPMHTVILDLCDKMLKPEGVCWFGDPGRYLSPDFYRLALSRTYQVRILNKELNEIEIPSSEGFQIFELRRTCISSNI
ncbi:methyltransferase [bacterium]|nr:methyltransferase [bacterium]